MIRTNSIQSSAPSIGAIESLQHIYKTECFYTSLTNNLLSESGSVFSYEDGRVVFHFGNLIDFTIKLLSYICKQLKVILKAITVKANDVNLDNSRFLYKYGARLNKLKSLEYEMDAYNIDVVFNNPILHATNVGFNTKVSFDNARSMLLDGKKIFKTNDDLNNLIAETRAKMLGRDNKSYLISDEAFKDMIEFGFGDKNSKRLATIGLALQMINSYDDRMKKLKIMNTNYITQAEQDIKELNRLKALLGDKNTKISRNMSGEDLKWQFDMLIRYRKQTMNDCMLIIGTLSEYIGNANKQAKSICIRALQEN